MAPKSSFHRAQQKDVASLLHSWGAVVRRTEMSRRRGIACAVRVALQRNSRLVGVYEHLRDVERLANADVRAVARHEPFSGGEALVMQLLQPRPRGVDAVSLAEQLDARRSDPMQTN